ncbi:hypothetical protein IIA28_19610 [candidate division KSB1 bacterium]|nr:hypothetical protein [candidate division KSB1 bacterium]
MHELKSKMAKFELALQKLETFAWVQDKGNHTIKNKVVAGNEAARLAINRSPFTIENH